MGISQKALRERMESPEGQELLDELARCFVQAAVTRLLKGQAQAERAQASEEHGPPFKSSSYADRNRLRDLDHLCSDICGDTSDHRAVRLLSAVGFASKSQ